MQAPRLEHEEVRRWNEHVPFWQTCHVETWLSASLQTEMILVWVNRFIFASLAQAEILRHRYCSRNRLEKGRQAFCDQRWRSATRSSKKSWPQSYKLALLSLLLSCFGWTSQCLLFSSKCLGLVEIPFLLLLRLSLMHGVFCSFHKLSNGQSHCELGRTLPINQIFRYLQNRSRVQAWIMEEKSETLSWKCTKCRAK